MYINMCHFDAFCHIRGWIILDRERMWCLKKQNSNNPLAVLR